MKRTAGRSAPSSAAIPSDAVLLSRGVPPGCLMAFQYAGLMTVLEPDALLFDRDDIRALFEKGGRCGDG